MKFSIVTPCYNGIQYLPQAVGSVRGQEGVEREHIIQDAQSSDGTVQWLETQPGLSFCSEADKGMYDGINRGWARASGDILSWLNVDEQYLPGVLKKVAREFEQDPEIDAVYGNTIMLTPQGEPLAARREIPLREIYVKNGFLYTLSCSLFFRRRLWDEGILRINDTYRNAGDMEMILRLLKAGKRFKQMHEYLSLFGVDGNNLTLALGDNMSHEVQRIREKYGALRNPLARKMVMIARYLERLSKGCYRPVTLKFDYATDEKPCYKRVSRPRVGGRFTYEQAARKMRC